MIPTAPPPPRAAAAPGPSAGAPGPAASTPRASRQGAGQGPRQAPRRGPRALLLITLCFAGSVVLRAGDRDGAIAREAGALADTLSATRPIGTPRPGTPGCAPDPGVEALLGAIRTREAQLSAREGALAEREQVLAIARSKLDEQMTAVREAEERLSATLAIADRAAEADIARLVSVYEQMNPKAAAQIFTTMDVRFAAGFVARMKPEVAAAILAGLPADRAYAVSAALATRNATAPTR